MKIREVRDDVQFPAFCNLERLEIGEKLNAKVKCNLMRGIICNAQKLETVVVVGRNRVRF
jgi:hypothetical protein